VVKNISVTILTKNSQKYLKRCLDALKEFNEIIVLDNGSNDKTLEMAKSYPNVKIIEHPFIGFGPLKNLAIKYAHNDWILSIDSDEIATPELIKEIKCINPKEILNIYAVCRENYYNGRLIKCCGWYPDKVLRFFNRTHTSFDNKMVHESLIIHPDTRKKNLQGTLKHFSFDSVAELIDKMQRYSTLYAEQSDKSVSPIEASLHALYSFIKNYFFQKGFLYGYEGFLISISNASGVFYKYMKLYEKHRQEQ